MIQKHTNNITEFASKFLSNKTPPSILLDLSQKDIETSGKLRNDDINLVSFKRSIRFLRETGRMDWDEGEQFLDFLKRK